jgi:hypothetical protein
VSSIFEIDVLLVMMCMICWCLWLMSLTTYFEYEIAIDHAVANLAHWDLQMNPAPYPMPLQCVWNLARIS